MDIQFQKLGAENFAELSKYYGRRHDNTCDSVMLDNFLWAITIMSTFAREMTRQFSGS